jgi:hypothetical protein
MIIVGYAGVVCRSYQTLCSLLRNSTVSINMDVPAALLGPYPEYLVDEH